MSTDLDVLDETTQTSKKSVYEFAWIMLQSPLC